MRQRIWLLALVVSASLACEREEKREAKRPATAAQRSEYTLKVRFEGLVGYVNTKDGVWAVLPKAHRTALPPGVKPGSSSSDYPEHHAVLKIQGASVNGIPTELRIAIEEYEIELEGFSGGTSTSGLPAVPFEQDPGDAAVEKLASGVLGSTPPTSLAARMKLPLSDSEWSLEIGDKRFLRVTPKAKTAEGFCAVADFDPNPDRKARVESVVWTKEQLTGDLKLKLRSLRSTDEFPLVLKPAQTTVTLSILNQVGAALYDPAHDPTHWPTYRWYYSLSDPSEQPACEKHYYPQGKAGGNRCPQKLYTYTE